MVDFWKLAKDFKLGDTVQRCASIAGRSAISPFLGTVNAVGTSGVVVRFPYGLERVTHSDLVKVDPCIAAYFPATLGRTDQRIATRQWRTTELPTGFHRDLARLWSVKASDIAAYDELWRKYASVGARDEDIRAEVMNFYLVARNLFELRIQQHAKRSAAYWAASNRQYRATAQDLDSRKPSCPKCGTSMRKTTYKMNEGARVRLFACPKDLFLVRQSDLLGPGGEPVEW